MSKCRLCLTLNGCHPWSPPGHVLHPLHVSSSHLMQELLPLLPCEGDNLLKLVHINVFKDVTDLFTRLGVCLITVKVKWNFSNQRPHQKTALPNQYDQSLLGNQMSKGQTGESNMGLMSFWAHQLPVPPPLPDAELCRHLTASRGAQPWCSSDHQASSAPARTGHFSSAASLSQTLPVSYYI